MLSQTSLISVYLLSNFIVLWTLGFSAAVVESSGNVEKNIQFHRVKRQFGDNFDRDYDGFDNFDGSDIRRFQQRRRGQNFQNIGNNFAGQRRQQTQRQQLNNNGNNELIFSSNQRPTNNAFSTPLTQQPNGNVNNNSNNNNQSNQFVFINNRPTIATMAPFTGRTTASPQFITCFNSCPTTSEYNPICGSDQELYFNEQKFNCAQRCGADIQIVRRGSCQGLFPMMRG